MMRFVWPRLAILLTLLSPTVFAQNAAIKNADAASTPPAVATPDVAVPANQTPAANENAEVVNEKSDGGKSKPATEPTSPTNSAAEPSKPVVRRGNFVLPPEKAAPVQMARFDKAPIIDGKLDDEVWKSAVVLKDFVQIDPGDNTPASRDTKVLLGFDSKTLYIAFVAREEQGKVRATVPRRDQIFNDDYIGFFLDTFNDQRRAYVVFFSPLGVQADGILTEGRGEDYSVDIVMESKGVVDEAGYIIEAAIPFKSLRYEAGKGKVWGAHFLRRIKHLNNELDSWMPFSRDVRGNLNQAGHLTGLEGIDTERTTELIPSLTLSETGRRVRSFSAADRAEHRAQGLSPVDPGRFVNEPLGFEPGLTAKFGISPQMTLDLAINPDFAQVEADQLVVTANQRFPIFYAERRPFFLEGIDIFQTRIQALHTRAIVDPDVAVKLTGKSGRNSYGVIVASDNAPGNFIGDERLNANNFRFLDKNAFIGVLRAKRDIGRENSIGFIATSYNFIEKHNDLAGIDGRFKWDQKYIAEFQVLGTTSRRYFFDPDESSPDCGAVRSTFSSNPRCDRYRTGNALAYNFMVNRATRRTHFELVGAGRTRDYRADVGFVQRTNTNSQGFYAGYSSEPKNKGLVRSWRLNNFSHINYDFQGRLQFWESEVHYRLNLPKQAWLHWGYERGHERLFEEEFGLRRTAARAGAFAGHLERGSTKNHYFFDTGMTVSKKYQFSGYANYRAGHFDLDFGGGRKFPRVSPAALAGSNLLDPGPGGLLELGATVNYQPTSALRATLNLTKNKLTRYDTGLVAFDDNIVSLRTQYQFTKFLFARARVDYTTLSANAKGQFLFGYTPSPGTAFYAGYNDDLNRNGFNPFVGSNVNEPGFRRNSRTFFLKASYLIRKSF